MQTWPIQDAKARFSEFLETCVTAAKLNMLKMSTDTWIMLSFVNL